MNINFDNVRKGDWGDVYVVSDGCSDIAQFRFSNGSLHVEVDNFPSQKKYYSTSFPLRNQEELAAELARVGIVLTKSEPARS
ncbi:TPA: hypothetical protein NG650_004222 [Vibrio parahaemolyticus]|nr:hypothetical protein [Vibrio parahaemolyticus]HCE1720346.1 hypothetical protein [Vibrio parahaemolyticus]HCE1730967.1 hypothetical protein [Vibrio parahaemolyticus]HCE3584533.1 hypothetical protein [Vibrio parahaemolyticus]HCG5663349.1 hypothetical protein [Vibrio parahaemolyticus]